MEYSVNFKKAIKIAEKQSDGVIRPVHLFMGILGVKDCTGRKVLSKLIDIEDTERRLTESVDNTEVRNKEKNLAILAPDSENIMMQSQLEAKKFRSNVVKTEHLVLAMARAKVINGITYQEVEKIIIEMTENSDKMNSDTKSTPAKKTKTPILDEFSTDLTKMAMENKLDPTIGRKKELIRIAQVLSRRKKNNPVLIGDPGVGKTAIVEGLAQMIINKQTPDILFNKRILALEMGSIVAGTKFRGEFEERMKKIVDELKSTDDVILYIDEIHTIVGAGGSSGSLDAANILKPALSRGEISCIGSTTNEEYKKIEKDGALDRRFQKIRVYEPTYNETREILFQLKERYEDHHMVRYSDEAIETCLKLADRYISDRKFPDKAIDALDEAGSAVRITQETPSEILKKEEEIENLVKRKLAKVAEHDFEGAASDKQLEDKLRKELSDLKNEIKSNLSNNRPIVTAENISEVISIMTGIPSKNISDDDTVKLVQLEKNMKKVVVGQDEAISKIAKSILRNKAGLGDTKRPIGTFLFLGPTGVGKCHGKGTPVIMFDGSIKNVEDVKVGDLLMGDDSTPRKVLSLARGKDNMYRITPLNGDSFTCNEPHMLSLKKTGTYDIVNIPLNEYLNKSNYFKHTHKLWKTKVNFPKKDVKIDPYFMGLWLGDGYSSRPGITTADEEIVNYIYGIADKYNMQININDQIIKDFRYYGLMDKSKNNIKFIPDDYLFNDEITRKKILSGFIDSDGYMHNNTVEISTKFLDLSKQIIYLCRSLGYNVSKKTKIIKNNPYYIISISGDMSDLPLLLKHKISSPRLQKKNVLLTQFKVEYIGVDDYYGFEIDGNNLYLLGDFTVTHNTYITKKLAEELFTSEKDMIRIDMSEYMEKHSVARLIGAPPGYIGHDDGGQLTEKVRRKPYSVILLDEVEKAHQDVTNVLLQVFDDGILTDSQGRTVDFKNTVIIMTSNIGSREAKSRGKGIGFNTDETSMSKSIVDKELKKKFAPEFLNRIDEIINFNSLDKVNIKSIIDIELSKFILKLKENEITVEVDETTKDFIFDKGWDPEMGARPLKRSIQKYIEDEISIKLITKEINKGDKVKIVKSLTDENLEFLTITNLLNFNPVDGEVSESK